MRFLTLLLMAGLACAAEPIALFAGDGGSARGAWVSGYGATTASVEEEPEPCIRMVFPSGGSAVVNFNKHQSLELAGPQADPGLAFTCLARLTAEGQRALHFGWRIGSDLRPVTAGAALAADGAWHPLVLPVTERLDGLAAIGWSIALDGPGTLELRSVSLSSRQLDK